MVLPKIVETEPWLEEDDDFPSKTRKKNVFKELAEHLTGLTKMIKTGVYLYIFMNLMSKSKLTSSLVILLKTVLITNKLYSPVIISAAITIFSLLHKKILN
jgi:hypothetical protein